MSCARTRRSVGPLSWTWQSTCSTACWSWDARTTSAWPNPGPGWGHCARIPDPCNTAARSGSRDGGSVAGTLATIDVNGLARHEARRFQIEDRAYDLRDLAHPAKRVQLGELRMCFDGMHRRLDDAGRNRIHSDAELCILDRQRFGRGTQA